VPELATTTRCYAARKNQVSGQCDECCANRNAEEHTPILDWLLELLCACKASRTKTVLDPERRGHGVQ
jgi:hypothetical protein